MTRKLDPIKDVDAEGYLKPTDMLEGMGKETAHPQVLEVLEDMPGLLREGVNAHVGRSLAVVAEHAIMRIKEDATALAAKDEQIRGLQMALDGCECANCVSARNAVRGPGDAALEGMGKETGDLIARLNAPSNWLRQSHGHWKGALNEYDRAPFEAATALAAKDAEIMRMREAIQAHAASITKGTARRPCR